VGKPPATLETDDTAELATSPCRKREKSVTIRPQRGTDRERGGTR